MRSHESLSRVGKADAVPEVAKPPSSSCETDQRNSRLSFNTIRVGIDCWGLNGSLLFTGAGQYTSLIIQALSARDDVRIVAYGAPDEGRPPWLPSNVPWSAIPSRLPRRFSAIPTRILTMRHVARRDGIDVFHTPTVHVRPSLPPVASTDCARVVTVHDAIPLSLYARDLPFRIRRYYAWNLRRAATADRIITVSSASRDEIAAYTDIGASRVDVIYHGIDFARNPDRGALGRYGVDMPYVLWAGSFEPRKNLRGALTAFASLKRDALFARYQMVALVEASSGHRQALDALIANAGMSLRLIHSVSRDDLRSLYTHADSLLFTSLAEGFGFPPLQAANCGTPVVASDLPAIREIMSDGALLVNPADPLAIAHGLKSVLRDPVLRSRLITTAQARARTFTREECARQHVEAYRTAIAAHRPRAPAP